MEEVARLILKAPTFKSAGDARRYGLKVGDIYIEVDTLKVLLPNT